MIPLYQILDEVNACLKIAASWELVKLEDDPHIREFK